MSKNKPATVDSYVEAAPKEAQKYLRGMRETLKAVAPEAKEAIKWRVPVFEAKRILFAYAAFKNHLNFMPTPAAIKAFKKELAGYKTGLGSIQFPYDKPLPKALITKIARYRVKDAEENDAKWM